MGITEKFLDDLKKFMRQHDMAKTAFGTLALNDPHAISDWMDGKYMPTLTRMDKVYAFMTKYNKEHK